MEEEDHPAFPYTEAFRRAKRNSLIWSGITIAAALGSPPFHNGEATLGQLGLSLTYDKSVLIGIAGVVAIFMAMGFYQAYRRIALHASQIFAGKTNVEVVFKSLSDRAAQARNHIDRTVNNFDKELREDLSGVGKKFQSQLFDIQKWHNERIALAQKFEKGSLLSKKFVSDNDIAISIPEIRQYISQVLEFRRENGDQIRDAKATLDELISEVFNRVAQRETEESKKIDREISVLEKHVAALTRFHSGIYRSEKVWFWTYDIAPTVLLFLIAMIPFVRLLIGRA